MAEKPSNPKAEPRLAVDVVPRLPEHLDEKARGEIRDAQDVMRQLIERIPRHFAHSDEIALTFRVLRGD